ncbi:hypothetical protein [Pseudoalteromonas rubra]|uniref:hypothetical protein n=1 Tax=Pseudoalteromonas rubra TaxID=43658 RepID=UPI000F7A3C45|nr:hypothetical protein [Pseudoalteromonas rubra]
MFTPLITALVHVFKPQPKRWAEQPFEHVVVTELYSAPCIKRPLETGDPILTMHEEGILTIGHVQKAPNHCLSKARNYDWREDPINLS